MHTPTHSADAAHQSSPTSLALAGPVPSSDRILALDATRGFALLGILCVNMGFFAEPLGRAIAPVPKPGSTAFDKAAAFLVGAFCEGKFFTLFSLLFGIGLTIQFTRATQRGEAFGWRGIRRLAFLCALGLLHALLLWYGDILFLYSICGLLLLAIIKWPAKKLLVLASILLACSVLVAGCFGTFSVVSANAAKSQSQAPTPTPPTDAATPSNPANADTTTQAAPAPLAQPTPAHALAPSLDESLPPFERLTSAWRQGKETDPNTSTLWVDMETLAYRQGPFLQAFSFRAASWALLLLIGVLTGFGAMILGMFALGAALLKLDFFSPQRRAWWPKLAAWGWGFGMPAGMLATWGMQDKFSVLKFAGGYALQTLAGFAMAIGSLSFVTWLIHAGLAKPITTALANAGRLGLTNYLTQTIVCTAIFYWWGFAQFGLWHDGERLLLAFAIFAAQLLLSTLYLRVFAIGPMEWLWRTVTYLKPHPFAKSSSALSRPE